MSRGTLIVVSTLPVLTLATAGALWYMNPLPTEEDHFDLSAAAITASTSQPSGMNELSGATSTPKGPVQLVYSFNVPGTIHEWNRRAGSASAYWRLYGGGSMTIQGGMGETIQGPLAASDYWRVRYNLSNPLDTQEGAYPQNIFRLASVSQWDSVAVETHMRIVKDNLVDTPNRNASNGLLLMSRYRDKDTLYYAGIRVDGTTVIKKKYNGMYYTMAQKKIFPGSYDKTVLPSLLPHMEWMGLRGETRTLTDGTVTVELFMQRAGGGWRKILSARDNGTFAATPPITGPGSIGIRTDFMDVQFAPILITSL